MIENGKRCVILSAVDCEISDVSSWILEMPIMYINFGFCCCSTISSSKIICIILVYHYLICFDAYLRAHAIQSPTNPQHHSPNHQIKQQIRTLPNRTNENQVDFIQHVHVNIVCNETRPFWDRKTLRNIWYQL